IHAFVREAIANFGAQPGSEGPVLVLELRREATRTDKLRLTNWRLHLDVDEESLQVVIVHELAHCRVVLEPHQQRETEPAQHALHSARPCALGGLHLDELTRKGKLRFL